MKVEKLEWLKKITAKQIVSMCILMVAIYFIAPLTTNDSGEKTNLVGSMGYSYEEEVSVMGKSVYVMHEEMGYMVKTVVAIDEELSDVENVFNSIKQGSAVLQEGVDGLVPASAVIRDYTIDNKILTLNLSESFLYYRNSIETDLLTSIVWSMTEIPGIERVHFNIEGTPVNNLNTNIDVGRGLTRNMGINLEIGDARMTNAQMVTLYFFTNDSEDPLLIPVSRLVSNEVDPFVHAVSSLVRGPVGAGYISVFNHQTTLLEQPKLENGILTLNFCSELFFDQDQTQVSSLVIKQLVMTLTEFEEVMEVSIVIEGSSRVFDDAGNPITVPVGRNIILNWENRYDRFVEES